MYNFVTVSSSNKTKHSHHRPSAAYTCVHVPFVTNQCGNVYIEQVNDEIRSILVVFYNMLREMSRLI